MSLKCLCYPFQFEFLEKNKIMLPVITEAESQSVHLVSKHHFNTCDTRFVDSKLMVFYLPVFPYLKYSDLFPNRINSETH